jgi:hypothetical protein
MTSFKKLIIIFWTIWWAIALWTDVVGGFKHLGWLTAAWAQDTNYPFLVKSLEMYSPSDWLAPTLFLGIIGWSLINVLLFSHACLALFQPGQLWLERAQKAFVVSLSFWLAFFIADQLVMKFDLEENHMVQGGFQWLTFLSLYWLPDTLMPHRERKTSSYD